MRKLSLVTIVVASVFGVFLVVAYNVQHPGQHTGAAPVTSTPPAAQPLPQPDVKPAPETAPADCYVNVTVDPLGQDFNFAIAAMTGNLACLQGTGRTAWLLEYNPGTGLYSRLDGQPVTIHANGDFTAALPFTMVPAENESEHTQFAVVSSQGKDTEAIRAKPVGKPFALPSSDVRSEGMLHTASIAFKPVHR